MSRPGTVLLISFLPHSYLPAFLVHLLVFSCNKQINYKLSRFKKNCNFLLHLFFPCTCTLFCLFLIYLPSLYFLIELPSNHHTSAYIFSLWGITTFFLSASVAKHHQVIWFLTPIEMKTIWIFSPNLVIQQSLQ